MSVACYSWPCSSSPAVVLLSPCVNFGNRPEWHIIQNALDLCGGKIMISVCFQFFFSHPLLSFWPLINTKQEFSKDGSWKNLLQITPRSLFIVWCLLITANYYMYSESWSYFLHCLAINDFHLQFCQPASHFARFFCSLSRAVPDFIVWSHQQTLSLALIWFFFFIWCMSTVHSTSFSAELCNTCLVASSTFEKHPFVIILWLLFLSCQ